MSTIPLSLLMLAPVAMAALALSTMLMAAAIGRAVGRLAPRPATHRPRRPLAR